MNQNLSKFMGKEIKFKKPTYMILTLISYPFGGGESFMYQTIDWALNCDFEVVWVAFAQKLGGNFFAEEIRFENNCKFHNVPGGFTEEKLENILKIYKPDVIHSQGQMNKFSKNVILKQRIPVIFGYHFWCGLLEPINGGWNNIDMMTSENKLDYFYLENFNQDLIQQYVASDFMNDVLKRHGGRSCKIMYPISSFQDYQVTSPPLNKRKYITLINIHKLKGGKLFLDMINNSNLPFMGVCSEPNPDSLDLEIKEALEKSGGKFEIYQDVKNIYTQTKIILLPGIVDETFCRVAYEAAANGIPILTTGKGFIKQLLGDTAVYLEPNPETWIRVCSEIYNSEITLNLMSKNLKKRMNKIPSQEIVFQNLIYKAFIKSKNINIAIFCPWGDTGLGIQSRGYSQILLNSGYNVHIFSFLPFLCYGKNQNFQKNPEEWKDYTTVYYSFNDRESVTNHELEHFIISKNIGIFMIPEICYPPIYPKLRKVKELGVKVIGIPNIETVRKDELDLWNVFDKILCNTHICENILNKYNVQNLFYLGHYVKINYNIKQVSYPLRFYHAAGYNPLTRKQTDLMCQAFSNIEEPFELIITFSNNIPNSLLKYRSDKIKFISKDISFSEIIRFYQNSHISVMMSSHEGLGLGFYDSISTGTPMITLDCPPHNEVINSKCGWLVKCTEFVLSDNNEALVPGYTFDPKDLEDQILEIIKNPADLYLKYETIKEEIEKWNKISFEKNLLSLLDK